MLTAPKKGLIDWCPESCRTHYMRTHDGHYPPCGCGRGHKMMAFGEMIVHFDGEHWVIDCLVEKLLRERTTDLGAIALLTKRMRKFQQDVATLSCQQEGCDRLVGKKYHKVGGMIYCHRCHASRQHFDIGGEG